ncbi:hypothetical protein SDC9_205901 [bioreactor metagenome]|uniref:Uncharacterized protein n=1 Tax=bioreactor metagenome TaxID=1076179 RepID=A0A645J4Y2_9ZZZZ
MALKDLCDSVILFCLNNTACDIFFRKRIGNKDNEAFISESYYALSFVVYLYNFKFPYFTLKHVIPPKRPYRKRGREISPPPLKLYQMCFYFLAAIASSII